MSEGKPTRRKIKTVGDLRVMLSEMIEGVISGEIDPHKASAIVKLSSQINASLLAEIEVARFALSQTNKFAPLGSLSIETPAIEVPKTIDGSDDDAPDTSMIDEPAKPQSRTPALAARVIDRRQSGVLDVPGTPPPGRSALDRRL